METPIIWLTKVILAHLLTDFVLQPTSWILDRSRRHFLSPWLYVHGLVTALAVLLLTGYQYWMVILIIFVTHILIDGWKSYRSGQPRFFLIDQALHLAVIFACWYALFLSPASLVTAWKGINTKNTLILITSFLFVSFPAGILISELTKKWRDQVTDPVSLGNAGKWIGIIERIIILTLVLNHQYETIGLLIAAKSLLRFSEANRPEIKTEYLLIGTLISISLAILTGITALALCGLK